MHYALARLVGTGTEDDPFRPPTDQPFSLVDLRAFPTHLDGFVVVATPEPDLDLGEYLGDDPHARSAAMARAFNRSLSVNLRSDLTLAGALGTLLTVEAREDSSRWSPIRSHRVATPQGLLRRREVWLGHERLWHEDIPVLEGGAEIWEDFNKSSSSTLGPHETWVEIINSWSVSNQRAVVNGSGTSLAYPDRMLDTVDQYAECDASVAYYANAYVGVCLRVNPSTKDRYRIEIGHNDHTRIIKVINGSTTTLELDTVGDPDFSYPESVGGRVQGSTINLFVNDQLRHTVTDTSITTGRYVGIMFRHDSSSDITSSSWIDNFYAMDLQRTKTLTGSIRPAGVALKTVPKVFAGSTQPAGMFDLLKVVLLDIAGFITPTGALTRAMIRNFAGSIRPAGSLLKRIGRAVGGGSAPSATIEFRPLKFLGGVIQPAGASIMQYIGRIFGRPGFVATTVRLAGEVRARIRVRG